MRSINDEDTQDKVKTPTRKTDVWGTQSLLPIYRPGHPPDIWSLVSVHV